jgi:hypothetical protein
MRFVRGALALLLAISLSACVTQHHRLAANLERPQGRAPKILVLPVDAELSELSFGGAPTPRQDWTVAARENMNASLRQIFSEKSMPVEFRKEDVDFTDAEAKIVRLHAAVGHSIMRHQYEGPTALPTKKDTFEWTLGPEAGALAGTSEANYMLAVHVRDSYSSASRVAAQFVAAAVFGVAIQGGVQIGFASLVDLKTGDIVWFNRLMRGAGDLRTPTPARETMEMLLAGMPQ